MAISALDRHSGTRLFTALVERQLRLRAKRALIGSIWPTFAPLALAALYIFVFHSVFRAPIAHYPLFLFSGLLPWTFVAQALASGLTSLTTESELIRRSAFRYELLPISSVASMFCFFLVTLAGYVIFLVARGEVPLVPLLELIPSALSLLLFVSGIALVLSLIDVFNRDLRAVLANLLTVWFFLLPITYQTQMVGGVVAKFEAVDPMSLIIGRFREALYYGHVGRPSHLLLMIGTTLGFFIVCLAAFRKLGSDLPKEV
ncbi:MAG: ABC transporter permease [Actinomycetota bacterium]